VAASDACGVAWRSTRQSHAHASWDTDVFTRVIVPRRLGIPIGHHEL